MPNAQKQRYCSWCNQKTLHNLYEKKHLRRGIWRCFACGNFTVKCRYCENMAKGKPANWENLKSNQGFFENIGTNWHNELCGEHDGTVASFKHLNDKWDDLEEYRILFKKEKLNLLKAGKYAGGVIGGVAVFGPLVYIAAPGIAASLGSAGALGAASTGTTISSLSGAALTNASLAAIGGGSMATGTAFVSATGMALGAVQGGVISHRYASDVKGFGIEKCNEGENSAVIFIDGFLTQKGSTVTDWKSQLRPLFLDHSWYHLKWESKTLQDLGSLSLKDVTGKKIKKVAMKFAKRASRKAAKKINPLSWATVIADIGSNPWHVAMVKASMTGILLADLLSRVKNTRFTLIGHSLGARVIYYALNALSTRDHKIIEDVYLLGGAVDSDDQQGWESSSRSVEGTIYNCYSNNDNILKYLYKPANVWLSKPIGLEPIVYNSDIIQNCNVSNLIEGHAYYRENLCNIIKQVNP